MCSTLTSSLLGQNILAYTIVVAVGRRNVFMVCEVMAHDVSHVKKEYSGNFPIYECFDYKMLAQLICILFTTVGLMVGGWQFKT